MSAVVPLGACTSHAPDSEGAAGESSEALVAAPVRSAAIGARTRVAQLALPAAVSPPITYHNGPVMHGTTNVYYIWYGNWPSGSTTVSVLTDFMQHLGGTPYFAINTTYSDGNGKVANAVHYAGSTTDAYSKGSSLTDANVKDIVSTAITNKSLPLDASGVYFVLTSADVTETKMCDPDCGWHNHASISGTDVKYAWIGDASTQCFDFCNAQKTGPNDSGGADGMAHFIGHELSETVTDPDLNAWYDSNNDENADKCAWKFGTEYKAANGARANVHLGSRDYLLQQNLVNAGAGYCALEGPGGVYALEGNISFLRVNEVGTGYGPPEDFIDDEVIVGLDSAPGRGFGFKLRGDDAEATHHGMLKFLRDSFRKNRRVHLEYVKNGPNNGDVLRVQSAP